MSSTGPGLSQQTVEFWERTQQRKLTLEQARQSIENVIGFFGVLARWQDAELRHDTPRIAAGVCESGS